MIERIVRDIKDPEHELQVVLQDRKVVIRIGSPTWQEQ